MLAGNRLLMVVVIIAVMASLPVIGQRVTVEGDNRTVELAIDLGELLDLSRREGYPVEDLLVRLKDAGVTSVAVPELTLKALHERGMATVLGGHELLALERTVAKVNPLVNGLIQQGEIRSGHTYVILVRDGRLFSWVVDGLRRRLPEGSLRTFSGQDTYVVEIHRMPEVARRLPVGMWPGDLQTVARSGLYLVPRFSNVEQVTRAEIEAAFHLLEGGATPTTVIFAGYEALGYPSLLADTASEIGKRGMVLGMVEAPVQRGFIVQRGTEELAGLTGYQVARVYSISRREMDKLSPATVVDRWVSSVKERNIRLLYLRPFLPPANPEAAGVPPAAAELIRTKDLVELNIRYLERLVEDLSTAGYRTGPAVPFGSVTVRHRYAWVMSWGVMAGGLLLISSLASIRPRIQYLLLVLGALAWVGLSRWWPADLLYKATALGSALVFPGLGIAWLLPRWMGYGRQTLPATDRRRFLRLWWHAVRDLLAATSISLVGGLLVAGLLGGTPYILEMEYFRGVKVAYITPLVVVAAVYFRAAGRGHRRPIMSRVLDVLRQHIALKHLVLMVLLGLVAFLYVGRAGHEAGIPVPGLEVRLRVFLDQTLLARPRLKEFLVGHPALMAAAVAGIAGFRQYLLPVALVAATGQVSVLNSFAHLRTPVFISFLRGINGLWLGILAGSVVLAALFLALWLERRDEVSRGEGVGK